ncbi:hypothetical protein B5F10_19580 [Anaerotruncus colihominis]|uniref:Iron-dependent peroxidase n=1 Tax=Anaerotruncus colihominis TaxID=169435 RepID=A0A1Y4MLZ1_9FIRM|nr:hypothetical protein [Anaerotruncus colihominis]NBI79165.1 hypothetical protein [Anaerotruncus colihominis]OUP66458.1 hypothetical protein B5F11_19400 [Anaerotruncus colihominis]OUP69738.1 hypothetical protein B5F10_19580 [Anaerotruncus colihominis]
MNYAWEALLLAEESGVKEEQVVFAQASAINPYLETAFEDLNLKGLENACVPVNPLYRFGPVFSALIDEQFDRFSASRGFLIDVLFHFLAQMDLMDGMSRLEYHRKFMQKEVVNGRYGKGTGEIFFTFPHAQRLHIVDHLLELYKNGASIALLTSLLQILYRNSIIYLDTTYKRELLIYIGKEKTRQLERQIGFLMDLFVPLDISVQLFWDMHFGIISVEETMEPDDIMIY